MNLSQAVWRVIRDRPGTIFTPKTLQYEALKRDISLSYEYAKKILQRLHRRGFLERISRGEYIFSPRGDRRNHQWGRMGTRPGGGNHPEDMGKTADSPGRRGHPRGFLSERSFPIRRQVFFIFWNNRRPMSIREVHLLVRESRGQANYRSVQSAINHFRRMGILERRRRGVYFIGNWDLARSYFECEVEGTPPGDVDHPHSSREIITVRHHFRIRRAVPLTREEFQRVSRYIWSREPVVEYVNGVYIEARPTGDGDRSHGVRLITPGATFHITYSYRKGQAKVMIYPRGRGSWTHYASTIFGENFTRRAIRIGISSHFGLNLDEITKVLWEGDTIRVTVNRSDFGASGDLEFEGISDEGAEYVRRRVLGEIEGIAREVDILESLKRAIGELSAHIYMLERDNSREQLQELRREVERIREHVEEHSRALALILRSINIWRNSGEVEGYA